MFQIHNTLSRKKEEFKPLHDKEVSFYQCGPTVYWTQHIGNMRAMVLADLIRRSLEYSNFKVKLIRNYTDVGHMTSDEDEGEDKMDKAAKREGRTPAEIADHYIKVFEQDIKDLNVLPPFATPRATEYIKQMQDLVQVLIDRGYAYATELAIYFDVSKVEDYTKLSGQKLEENIAEAGKGEVGDSDKKNSTDFAVWFFKAGAHKNALQTWPSKFKLADGEEINREGFPGWHIECSAMSKSLLGDTIDIHMGGIEHIPVHHTNEIAQSESANGVKFVNYWLHNEHLNVDAGKMSKSEGTSYALADIKEKGYDPLALRYFFLQAHYRSKQNFTWKALDASQTALYNLRDKILQLGSEKGEIMQNYKNKFIQAIEDDFNIPQALALVWDILKSESSSYDKLATILDFDKVLGLNLSAIERVEIPEEVIDLAEERRLARRNKNWAESDRLREEIRKLGFEVEDSKDEYRLKKI